MTPVLSPLLNVSLGYDSDTIGASGSVAGDPTAEFQFRLADPAPEQSCRLVPGESPIFEKLAEQHAANQDFAKALSVGFTRRRQGFSDPQKKFAWDLKVAAWAEAVGELHLALKIYLGDRDLEMPVQQRGLFVKPGYEEGFLRLQNPHLWIEAARRKIAAGDLFEAEPFLKEASDLNKDREVDAEIAGLRQEIDSAKAGITDRFIQEIQSLEAKSQKALPQDREAISARRDRAWSDLGIIQELDKLPIAHFNAKSCIERAKVKLASGYFNGDEAAGEEGREIFRLLQECPAFEKRKQAVFDTFVDKGIFYVFADEIHANAKDRSEWFSKMMLLYPKQIPKTLQRLDGKGPGIANPALAAYAHDMLGDLEATADLQEEREDGGLINLKAAGFTEDREGKVRDLAALRIFVAKQKRLYGGDKAKLFYKEIFQDDQAAAKAKGADNEGYQVRQQLDESLQAFKKFDHSHRLLEQLQRWNLQMMEESAPGWFEISHDGEGPVPLNQKAVKEFHKFLLERSTAYQNFLKEELQRAKKNDQKEIHLEDLGSKEAQELLVVKLMAEQEKKRSQEAQAQEKLDRFNKEFSHLKEQMNSLGGNVKVALAILDRLNSQVAAWEDDRTRSLLSRELTLLKGAEASSFHFEPIERALSEAHSQDAYRAIMEKIDFETLRAEVEGRVKAYAQMEKEVSRHDYVLIGLYGCYHLSSPLSLLSDGDWSWKDRFHRDRPYEFVKKKYQEILALVNSGNPNQIKEAHKKFLRLNNATIHRRLYDSYSNAETWNRYTIGVGILAAAGLTGGFAGAAVAAYLGGGALFVGATNAVVFTLSTRVLRGAVYDGLDGVGSALRDVPTWGFAGETLSNGLMFAWTGFAVSKYQRAFAAAAERSVVQDLTGQGLLLTFTPLAREEMVQMGLGWDGKLLQPIGAFFTETAALQTFGFVSGLAKGLAQELFTEHSHFDLLDAVKQALGAKAWTDGGFFVGALKFANLVGMLPPFSRMNRFLAQKIEEQQNLYGDESLLSRWIHETFEVPLP